MDSAAVLKAVEDFQDPETGRSVVTMEQVTDIRFENDELYVTLALSTLTAPLWEEIRADFGQRRPQGTCYRNCACNLGGRDRVVMPPM